jgi:hypothetical protein
MTIVRRLVVIAYFVEVGLLLLIVPWTDFLLQNYFVAGWPAVRAVVSHGMVKGLISGLGLINLGAGLAEVVGLFTDRGGADGDAPPAMPGREGMG